MDQALSCRSLICWSFTNVYSTENDICVIVDFGQYYIFKENCVRSFISFVRRRTTLNYLNDNERPEFDHSVP